MTGQVAGRVRAQVVPCRFDRPAKPRKSWSTAPSLTPSKAAPPSEPDELSGDASTGTQAKAHFESLGAQWELGWHTGSTRGDGEGPARAAAPLGARGAVLDPELTRIGIGICGDPLLEA